MKRVIVAIVLFAAVAIGCVVMLLFERQVFGDLTDLIDTAETCYRNGDVEGALAAAERLSKQVPQNAHLLCVFLPHQALSELEKGTAGLPLILRYGDPRDFPAEARRCRLMLQRVWDQEKPLLENIL